MIFFKSLFTRAIVAANTATNAPKDAINIPTFGIREKTSFALTTKYTPAVTIVAAWISADTGVGPSIASASQV